MGVHARCMHGVAQTARGPEYRRMVSASDRQLRAPFRQPGHGPRHQGGWRSPARAWPSVGNAGAPARLRQPRIRKTARHRPVSTPTLTAGRRGPAQGARISPVAGQPPAFQETGKPPAEQRRCFASSRSPPHVTAVPEGFPPAWSETFSGPSGSGSGSSMAWGEGVWTKWGDFGPDQRGTRPLRPRGGESEFQRLGFSQVLEISGEGARAGIPPQLKNP